MKNLQLTFFLVFIFLTTNAQTAADLFTKLNLLDLTVNNGLPKAKNVLSAEQRMLYTNLVNYTAYLKSNLESLPENFDRKLTHKEISLLTDVRAIEESLRDKRADLQLRLQKVASVMANAPTQLGLAKLTPTPTFYRIPEITTVQNKTITIDISGMHMSHPNNHIIFNGKKIPVTGSSDSLLSFSVPLTIADVFKADTINTFKLVLFYDRALAQTKQVEYTSRFVVVPKIIADIKITFVENDQEAERNLPKLTEDKQVDHISATSVENKKRETSARTHLNFNEQKVKWLPSGMEKLVEVEVTYFDGSTFVTSEPVFDSNFIDFRFKPSEKLCEIKFKP